MRRRDFLRTAAVGLLTCAVPFGLLDDGGVWLYRRAGVVLPEPSCGWPWRRGTIEMEAVETPEHTVQVVWAPKYSRGEE